jgi:hypothetical protein
LRDGVTGNTSGFEPEDEGSTPSPAASCPRSRTSGFGGHYPPQSKIASGTSGQNKTGEVVFIRFFSGRINKNSQVPAGLFCAAYDLRGSDSLPDYELEALTELKD